MRQCVSMQYYMCITDYRGFTKGRVYLFDGIIFKDDIGGNRRFIARMIKRNGEHFAFKRLSLGYNTKLGRILYKHES